jgi:hypothetical protein
MVLPNVEVVPLFLIGVICVEVADVVLDDVDELVLWIEFAAVKFELDALAWSVAILAATVLICWVSAFWVATHCVLINSCCKLSSCCCSALNCAALLVALALLVPVTVLPLAAIAVTIFSPNNPYQYRLSAQLKKNRGSKA